MSFQRAAALTMLMGGLIGLTGCAPRGILSRERQATREQALAYIDQGKQKEREGALGPALDRYDKAARAYPNPQAYYLMGHVFELQGKNEPAAAAYQEALRLAPDYQDARLAIISLGFTPPGEKPTEKDLAQAAEHSEKRKQEIAALTARAAQGGAAEEKAQERQETLAEAAEKKKPTQEEVRTALFPAQKEPAKRPSATAPVYTSDQDIILGTYPYHYQKAEDFRRRLQFDKAVEEYERAIAADPGQVEARLDLGDVMMRLERPERAKLYYEKAVLDFPQSAKPLFKMGTYYAELNQNDRARDFYRRALDKDSNYAEAYNNLAVLDMKEKKYPQAKAMLDELIRLKPDYANAYLNRGIIAQESDQDKAEALRNYRKYVELSGTRASQVKGWISELEGAGQ